MNPEQTAQHDDCMGTFLLSEQTHVTENIKKKKQLIWHQIPIYRVIVPKCKQSSIKAEHASFEHISVHFVPDGRSVDVDQ